MNLWAFNKTNHYNQPIVIIKFNNESPEHNAPPVAIFVESIKLFKKSKLAYIVETKYNIYFVNKIL